MTIYREELAAIKKRHEEDTEYWARNPKTRPYQWHFDRAALLDALEAAEARDEMSREALEEIAKQKMHAEITDGDPDEIDWLGGYEGCVKRARSALAETAP